MSFRFDEPLIAGSYHFGNRGLGVIGSDVASTGTYGPGYIYPSLDLPADANKEYRGYVVTPPGVGTFFTYEDSSFDYSGPSTSFVFRLYEDGADLGTETVYIEMPLVSVGCTWEEDNDSHVITTNINVSSQLIWLDQDDLSVVNVSLSVIPDCALNWVEVDDSFSSVVSLLVSSSLAYSEVDDQFNISTSVLGTNTSYVSWAESDDIYSISSNALQSPVSNVNWVEDSDSSAIVVQVPVHISTIWVEHDDAHFIMTNLPSTSSPIISNLQVKFRSPKYKITFRRV